MTRHRTVHKAAPKPKKMHKSTSTKPKTAKKVHVHQALRSHHVRIVHSHISTPKPASNPYKVIVV